MRVFLISSIILPIVLSSTACKLTCRPAFMDKHDWRRVVVSAEQGRKPEAERLEELLLRGTRHQLERALDCMSSTQARRISVPWKALFSNPDIPYRKAMALCRRSKVPECIEELRKVKPKRGDWRFEEAQKALCLAGDSAVCGGQFPSSRCGSRGTPGSPFGLVFERGVPRGVELEFNTCDWEVFVGLVDIVCPESVAANAGIVAGDQIISMGGEPVGPSITAVEHYLLNSQNDDSIQIELLRNGKKMQVELRP